MNNLPLEVNHIILELTKVQEALKGNDNYSQEQNDENKHKLDKAQSLLRCVRKDLGKGKL